MLPVEHEPTRASAITVSENGTLVYEGSDVYDDRLTFRKPTPGMWLDDDNDGISSVVLAALVALLILLAAVIWIAFCMALHRTAKRLSAMKRQRRRQVIIANAINRALADNRFEGSRAAMPNYLATLSPTMTAQLAADLELRDLPTYEQALSMPPTVYHSPVPQDETTSVVKPRKLDKVIRIAPDRPGSIAPSVLPPSYASAVACSTSQPASPRDTVATISRTVSSYQTDV